MSNDAKKMSLENQITLCQNNAIEFVHACMSIALHEVFGVGRDRLDKVNRVRDELNGRMIEIMTRPAKRQRDQLTAAEQWITGLLPEGVETTLRVPVLPLSDDEVRKKIEAVLDATARQSVRRTR